MVVIFGILLVLLVVLLGVTTVSNSVTQVAMADALRQQAQAANTLAATELVRQLIVLVSLVLLTAVVILVIVTVRRRKTAVITRRESAPQLPVTTPMDQLTQLFAMQMMREMRKDNSLYSVDERER